MQPPLEGVRVLDISEFGFVPSAAAVLGDWGADVVKVEKPSGDPLRGHGGMIPGTADFEVLIEHFNRNKRGIVLDLSGPEGRAVLERLLGWADVLVTNFLPRTLEKLGLTAARVHERHPRMIVVRGTGQGSRGPDAHAPGFDGATWWARGGVADTLSPPGASARMRPALGDGPTGMMLAGGVAAALFRRERTGHGAVVETSLLQGAMWTLAPDLTSTALVGTEPPAELPASSFSAIVAVYVTADGRRVQLTMPDDRWWAPACRALGLEQLLDDDRFREPGRRVEHAAELRAIFERAVRSRNLSELVKRLSAEGCVFAPFASVRDVLSDPQVEANGFMPPHPTHPGARLVASPIQFDGQPIGVRRGAPRLGEHSVEVLAEVGYSDAEVAELLEVGATRQAGR